jgi:phosphatidylglycerol:prolipoprotein diacylglycerol transferase
MIDPVIFQIGNFAVRWYGVIVMTAIIVGSVIVERELKRRGGNSDLIWDALIWVVPVGVIGARLWYVLNATLGGNRAYLEDPASILRIWEGGLHIFGAFLFGGIALLWFLRRNNLDPWLFLDAIGPAALIGQGIGRIANFINQELYGPPTTLPWGIPIEPAHRLPEFQDESLTTRFHPTFAYEMLWNFAAAGLLLWLARRYEKDLKPGALFSGWLILAGIGRVIIEFFRPDQPKIEGLGISYSSIFAALMAIAGAVLLMVRYKAINLPAAENWEEEYRVGEKVEAQPAEIDVVEEMDEVEEPVEPAPVPRARKASPTRAASTPTKKPAPKTPARRTTKKTGSTPRNTRAKKNS